MNSFIEYLLNDPVVQYLRRVGFTTPLFDVDPESVTTNWTQLSHPSYPQSFIYIDERERWHKKSGELRMRYSWECMDAELGPKTMRLRVKSERQLNRLVEGTEVESAFRLHKLKLLLPDDAQP